MASMRVRLMIDAPQSVLAEASAILICAWGLQVAQFGPIVSRGTMPRDLNIIVEGIRAAGCRKRVGTRQNESNT